MKKNPEIRKRHMLLSILLFSVSSSIANDDCPEWCGDPLEKLTIWTDNPVTWRCELPSVDVEPCADVAQIICLRLDDLGGDLYQMLFRNSPNIIGIDPDYLAKGSVDMLVTTIECRDGAWMLPERDIRITYVLCDQYIIDKRKAADSPNKPANAFLNFTTMTMSTTIADFDVIEEETTKAHSAQTTPNEAIDVTAIQETRTPQKDYITSTTKEPKSSTATKDIFTTELILEIPEETEDMVPMITLQGKTTPLTTLSSELLLAETAPATEPPLTTSVMPAPKIGVIKFTEHERAVIETPTTSATKLMSIIEVHSPFTDILDEVPLEIHPLKLNQSTPGPLGTTQAQTLTRTIDDSDMKKPQQPEPYDGPDLIEPVEYGRNNPKLESKGNAPKKVNFQRRRTSQKVRVRKLRDGERRRNQRRYRRYRGLTRRRQGGRGKVVRSGAKNE